MAPEEVSIGHTDGKGSTAIGTGATVVIGTGATVDAAVDVVTGMAATIVGDVAVTIVADTTGIDRAHIFWLELNTQRQNGHLCRCAIFLSNFQDVLSNEQLYRMT